MPRIRSIHPEFWSDERMVEIPFGARLLFIGTWNFADDEGRLEDNPGRLRLQVFPGNDVTPEQVDGWLDLLAANNGPIIRYEVDGQRYIQVRNFRKYQSPSHPRRSKLPPPDLDARGLRHGSRASSPGEANAASPQPDRAEVGVRHGSQALSPGEANGAGQNSSVFTNGHGVVTDYSRNSPGVVTEYSHLEGKGRGKGTPSSQKTSSSSKTGRARDAPEGYAPTIPAFKAKMQKAMAIQERVALLVEFVQAHGPDYAGPDIGGRAAGFLKALGGDGSRALALLVQAVAKKPDGDVFSYAHALAKQRAGPAVGIVSDDGDFFAGLPDTSWHRKERKEKQ